MKLLRMPCLILFLCLPAFLSAGVIRVNSEGTGDYPTIPWAAEFAGANDTILVAAGTYDLFTMGGYWYDWPIELHEDSPLFLSEDGAEATIISGSSPGSTLPAFSSREASVPKIRIVGFTLKDMQTPVDRFRDYAAVIEFRNNIVESTEYGLNAIEAGGVIAGNEIHHCQHSGISIFHCRALIENNEFHHNQGYGIAGSCCESPLIQFNHVHHNNAGGIMTGYAPNLFDNLVEHNTEFGVVTNAMYGGRIEQNIIRFNDVGLRVYDCDFTMKHNQIYENELFDLEAVATHLTHPQLDATYNYWGTTDPDLIAKRIWDCSDDPGAELCCVNFEPFCASPDCVTATEPLSWSALKALYR